MRGEAPRRAPGRRSAREMADFLTSQLDYVYFVYGLALVLLGAVAATIPRGAAARLPWGWLAGFAFVHGTAEWLHIANLALVGPPAFHLAITLVLLASYTLLLEFARRSHRVLRGSGPGPWLTWLGLAVPVVAAVNAGAATLAPAMRVLVALPASIWTAFLVGTVARRTRSEGGEAGGSLDRAAQPMATARTTWTGNPVTARNASTVSQPAGTTGADGTTRPAARP
jgi:hypothetical protein